MTADADRYVEKLEFINNYKDVNTWNVIVNCYHVAPGDEIYVCFSQTEFVLCEDCVNRLYSFVWHIDDDL